MNCIEQVETTDYALFNGDCVEVIAGLPDRSVDYSIFSPPFSTCTPQQQPRDMGNCRSDGEFFEHFGQSKLLVEAGAQSILYS